MNGDRATGNNAARGRVLCVTSNFPRWRGDSTTPFVLHLAQDLQALGWQIDVLAPHAPDAAFHEMIDGIKVDRFRYLWPDTLQTVCYQGGALINLRKNKFNSLKLPALVVSEWLSMIWRLFKYQYDLLHSHWILPQGFTGVLAATPLRVPHVLTVHGGDVFALQSPLMNKFKRFALSKADAVTVNSSVTRQAVAELAPQLEPYRIPMGVSPRAADRNDPKVQQLKQRYRRGKGPLLIFVGRVVQEKGIADLIQAVNILKTPLPDVTALIVGEGQDRAMLETLTRQAGLTERVTFTGWIEAAEIPFYLAASDIFLGLSRQSQDGWKEAQGLTFLEAMVAQTPVIATRAGGIIDAVRDEQTGLLVNERAPEEAAAAVQRLVQGPELADRLRAQGYQLAVNEFSRSASAKAFTSLYTSLIKK